MSLNIEFIVIFIKRHLIWFLHIVISRLKFHLHFRCNEFIFVLYDANNI